MGRALAWLGPWAGVAGIAAWSSVGTPSALVLAGSGALVGAASTGAGGSRLRSLGLAVVLLAAAAGFSAQERAVGIRSDWDGYWSERSAFLGGMLGRAMAERLSGAEEAVAALGEVSYRTASDTLPSSSLAAPLASLRRAHDLAALALYRPNGTLLAWDGTHRGPVPEAVQAGEDRYGYHDRALFGYLYVTQADSLGRVAVAAHLMRTDLSPALGARLGDFVGEFARVVDENVSVVSYSDRAGDRGDRTAFDLALPDGRVLLSVEIEEPDPEVRASRTLVGWRVGIAGAALLAWILLMMGMPSRPAGSVVAAGTFFVIAVSAPFEELSALAGLFDSDLFALPGPVPMTMGRLLLAVCAVVVLVASMGPVRSRVPAWTAAAALAAALPALVGWTTGGLRPFGLVGGRLETVAFAVLLMGLLTLTTGLALATTGGGSRGRARGARSRTYATGAAVMLSLALAACGTTVVVFYSDLPGWWSAVFALPAFLFALATQGMRRGLRFSLTWAGAAFVGGCAALPQAWAASVRSEVHVASELLVSLAAAEDPVLLRSLSDLSETADSLSQQGRAPVEVMYGAWRASGLAGSSTPLRISVGDTSLAGWEELRVGVGAERPSWHEEYVEHWLSLGRGGPEVLRLDKDDARYLIVRRLADGGVLAVAAGPLMVEPGRSPLAALVEGEPGRGPDLRSSGRASDVVLIPLQGDDPRGYEPLTWSRTEAGWQGNQPLRFSDGAYQAHYTIAMPGPLLLMARGTILFLIGFGFLALFWLTGRSVARELLPGGLGAASVASSFRVRITGALFAFFVLAVAIFGTVAYQTLNQASARSARVIAERVVADAAASFENVQAAPGTRLERLSRQVRAELLEYRGGELRGGGSVAELVELGLYEGWMPMAEHLRLDGREGVAGLTETSLGRWRYVTAFRRLPDGDVLGAQVPFQAGTTAIRTTDLIELLAFALLVGAVLSFILAWLGGRTLSSPLRVLRDASEGVGAGNLAVRLPRGRRDQFGVVYAAFNRMVDRLSETRSQLERTSRRTQAIMDEAAVGMIALDSNAKVMLVNPSALSLLGDRIRVGYPVPGDRSLGRELRAWLGAFLEENEEEATTDIASGERRVKVRARMLGRAGSKWGVVVALDDVTDELRTERVLAWGEMARQVAHEIKNPLTPLKLSIQHLRRAWDRRDPDFEDILLRNAEVMLKEIESLSSRADSFRRIGAPGRDGGAPLGPVDVSEVVNEVLALYRSGAPTIAFQSEVDAELPAVTARRDELKEVLTNLVENARKAVETDGSVRVAATMAPTGRVAVEVSDDGCGIPEEIQARIFEPRFSTRSSGMGLGLAIVARLAESWGGEASVESAEGEGATARLLLTTWKERKHA